MRDFRQRFSFETLPIRGGFCRLEGAYRRILEHGDLPPVIARLLGEAAVATALLASALKFEDKLLIQVQGQGPLRLLVAESDPHGGLRAYARWDGQPEDRPLTELCPDGVMAITVDPGTGFESYQGIVELRDSIGASVGGYFTRSEQLPTIFHLSADPAAGRAAGLFLQRLPGTIAEDDWQRVTLVSETVRPAELLSLTASQLLRRLYPEDDLRLYDPQPLAFVCHCSRGRVARVLRALGPGELESLLAEEGAVKVSCEYCGAEYRFDAVDVAELFVGTGAEGSASVH